MTARTDRLRAELALAEAEDAYEAHKAAYRAAREDVANAAAEANPDDVYKAVKAAVRDFEASHADVVVEFRAAKYALRALRREFREKHRVTPSGPGDAAPSPETVTGVATVAETMDEGGS